MSINYNKIKDLVFLLYEFVYNKNDLIYLDYVYEKFDWENIKIEDLISTNLDYQIILNSNYDKKDNFKIINIFGDKIFKKIVLKKYFKDYPLTLIIQKYKTNNEPTNIIDIIYELFINQIITEFAIVDKIPFFLLNINNFNIQLSKLSNYSDFYNLIINEYNLYDPNDLDSNFCISIYEHYHSYITFNQLLNMDLSNDDIINILFQIFYIYAYLQTKLDNFYHGEYNINSFLIIKNNNNFLDIKLKLGDSIFLLPKQKYICKLFNYRKSQINGFKNLSEKNEIIDNPSYSMYTILKSLYDNSNNINIKNFENIKIIISNFIPLDILSKKFMDESQFYNIYIDSINPSQILIKNNIFSSFINMNFKNNTINQDLIGGNYNKKNIDLLNLKKNNIESSVVEEYTGYRMLSKNFINNQEGGKKNKKKSNKKSLKKSSKKHLKKTSKINSKNKQSRQNYTIKNNDIDETYEEIENIDYNTDNDDDDDEDDEDNEKIEKIEINNDINNEEINEPDDLSIETEEENETLVSEGDDDNNKVPIDSEEMGKNYKKIIKNLMDENKKLKKKSKKLKKNQKQSKLKVNNDSSISFDLDDDENGSNEHKLNQHIMPMNPQMNPQMNMQINPINMQNPNTYNNNIMLPDPNFMNNGIVKMKAGTNNNFNEIFSNLNNESLIPILPEMQQNFDINQIANLPQHNNFSSGFEYGTEPKIMDSGLLNNKFGMKRQLPLINDPNMASIAGINQFGNSLQGELGKTENINKVENNINNILPNDTNILKGGEKKKNFFLTKN